MCLLTCPLFAFLKPGIEPSPSSPLAYDNEFKEGKRSVVYNDDDDDDDGEGSSVSEGTAILSNTDKI